MNNLFSLNPFIILIIIPTILSVETLISFVNEHDTPCEPNFAEALAALLAVHIAVFLKSKKNFILGG